MGNSFFDYVSEAPADAIFNLTTAFMEDRRAQKVNLSVGIYRDEKLRTPVLKSVKAAEKYLLVHEKNKEYLPIGGDRRFVEECGKLVFGDTLPTHICGLQVPGGTGGIRIGADFVRQEVSDTIAIPNPTWPNHLGVFRQAGFKINSFSYYNTKKQQLDTEALFSMLEQAPARSVVLFHACCHNPTGADLDLPMWNRVADIMKNRFLLPFFDFAYQGFGRGIEEDAEPIRLFVKKNLECLVATSYSKNFGLYSERVGALFVSTKTETAACHVLSKLKIFARTAYSNPPKHGAAIVEHILSHPGLKKKWMKEVDEMRDRIRDLREQFVSALSSNQTKVDFSSLLNQMGMFCYLGLDKEKVAKLRDEYGIYMAEGGRINLAGLSRQNFNYVVESLTHVL